MKSHVLLASLVKRLLYLIVLNDSLLYLKNLDSLFANAKRRLRADCRFALIYISLK